MTSLLDPEFKIGPNSDDSDEQIEENQAQEQNYYSAMPAHM